MRDHICRFCNKGFSSEKTLQNHMCVKKKRFAEKDTVGSRLGLVVFQKFHQFTTPNAKKVKSFEDFIDSRYYSDFVKFGRHLIALDPINTDAFIDFVIKNGVKLNLWCSDQVYELYLEEIVRKETPEMAIERTILEMQRWASENQKDFLNFFREVSPVEATFMIKSGKISPWVLYLSESGGELLDRMSTEQAEIIHRVIDPTKWQVKFMTRKDDVDFVSNFLKECGI